MKIDKEKFNELKQLDRIEFRQRYDAISSSSLSWYFIGGFTALLIFSIALVIFGVGIQEPLVVEKGYSSLASIFILFFVCIPFVIVIDLMLIFITSKNRKELIEEYFKVEIKK